MFAFLVSAYRRLEAAISREAQEAERGADLRKSYNDHVEASLKSMGVLDTPTNRIADHVGNGKKSKVK